MDLAGSRGSSASLAFGQPDLDVLDERLIRSCTLSGLLLPILGGPKFGLLEFARLALLLLFWAPGVLHVTLEPVNLAVVPPELARS